MLEVKKKYTFEFEDAQTLLVAEIVWVCRSPHYHYI